MISTDLFEAIHWHLGPFVITGSIVVTWVIILFLTGFLFLSTRNLSQTPGRRQVMLEAIILSFEGFIEEVLPGKVRLVFPFIASLWIFILVANLVGLIPGMGSPTADISVTLSMSCIVFFSVHWFGIKEQGLRKYLHHYLMPNPILLPFHIISEISRTLALSIRLFGNVMSLEIAALLVLMVAGFIVPIPLLMLHIVEAVIQAYLFGMLALIYIAGGIQSQEKKLQKENL